MTQHRSSACCRSVAITLMVLLLCQSGLAMQATSGLRLVVIEGNGAQYTVEQVPENTITVRLVDRNNRPVPDVGVVFASPDTGPSGEFINGLTRTTVITDAAGLAVTRLYHPNVIVGTYDIEVTAEYQGEKAQTTIRQRNIAARRSMSKKLLIIVGAGAAAGAALALSRGGGSDPVTPPQNGGPNPPPAQTPSISFGSSTVGAPQP